MILRFKLGGAGYIRDYPVEQLYRDQRLNPIHEGTEGIHGLDLLGRKVLLNNGESFQTFLTMVARTVADAENIPEIAHLASPVKEAIERTARVTESLLPRVVEDPDSGLANATIYLDMFGQFVMAWIWLQQAVVASRKLSAGEWAILNMNTISIRERSLPRNIILLGSSLRQFRKQPY